VALYSTKLGLSGRDSDNRTRFFDLDIHFLTGTANKNSVLKNQIFRELLGKAVKVQAPEASSLKENQSTFRAI